MHRTIDFPNIGIHLKSVGDHITVFGFEIAYYGIIIGIGILTGILIAALEARRTKQNPEDYYDLAIYAVIFAIIGARIYYVIFSWDMYKDNLLSIFNIREGGLAIYGGVIAAVITVFVFAHVKHLSAPLLLDTAGLGLVAGQMIGAISLTGRPSGNIRTGFLPCACRWTRCGGRISRSLCGSIWRRRKGFPIFRYILRFSMSPCGAC